MVGPDHRADAGLAEPLGRRAVIGRRHDDDRAAIVPLAHEGEDLRGGRLLRVDQHRVGACRVIGLGATQRLVEPPARDQRLDAGNDAELGIGLAVLAGLDLAAELVDVGQRLALAEKRVGLGEQLVLDADAGDAALAQLAHQSAHVVEVAVAGIAVDQDRDRGRVRHELEHLEHLGPRRLVAVAHAERRRHRQPGRPDALEPGLLHDLGRQPVMGLHQERELRSAKLGAQPGRLGSRLCQNVRTRIKIGRHPTLPRCFDWLLAAIVANFPLGTRGQFQRPSSSRAPIAAGDHGGTFSLAVAAIANPPDFFRVTPSGFPLGNAHGGSG